MKNLQTLPTNTGLLLQQWGTLWKIEDLGTSVHIEFSPRLTRSLGRCYVKRGLIRLNPVLNNGAGASLYEEVLCHEVAHHAVYLLFGRGCRPHGLEWKELMLAAGFPARTSIKSDRPLGIKPRRMRRRPLIYKHRCPICQAVWMARKPMKNWRCSDCYHGNKEGVLVITSYPANRGCRA